jgi:DNA-binding SARP family transcriptional activator
MVCLLGSFRLLKLGKSVVGANSAKIESLLRFLVLRRGHPASREALLNAVWPDADRAQAGQSLNSLIYGLRKSLRDETVDFLPVLQTDGYYELNIAAGVGVDIVHFDKLVDAGACQAQAGNMAVAVAAYTRAASLYRGDLCTGGDVADIIERERLRARFLSVLANLADYHFGLGNYAACLDYAGHILAYDPYREDAVRMQMRCYVRRGERAQAFRQYRLCREILQAEFDAEPEPTTTALHDQIRLDPSSV